MDHPIRPNRGRGPRRWQLATLGALLVAAACSSGPSSRGSQWIVVDLELSSRLDRVAAEAFAELQIAGMSVAVSRGDDLVFAAGYGYADLAEQVPAQADTIYRLGSIGKSFTAAALLQLAEDGRLSLDEPVTARMADYPPAFEAIAVHHLLSHTSGVAEYAVGPVLERTSGVGQKLEDVLDLVVNNPLEFEPGTRWAYSNAGFMLAGELIESVAQMPYAEYIRTEVLEPLGLSDTFVCPDEPPADDQWASGYEVTQGNWQRAVRLGRSPGLADSAPINMDVIYAAGSLCASAIDLVRWPDLLENELLSPESFAAMTAPTVLSDGTKVGYGLGLELRAFADRQALAHGGVINGFVTMLADFPDDDTTVVLLVNTLLTDSESQELLRRILGAVFDEAGQWGDPYQLEPVHV